MCRCRSRPLVRPHAPRGCHTAPGPAVAAALGGFRGLGTTESARLSKATSSPRLAVSWALPGRVRRACPALSPAQRCAETCAVSAARLASRIKHDTRHPRPESSVVFLQRCLNSGELTQHVVLLGLNLL